MRFHVVQPTSQAPVARRKRCVGRNGRTILLAYLSRLQTSGEEDAESSVTYKLRSFTDSLDSV